MNGEVFFRGMELQDKLPFSRVSTEFVRGPGCQPLLQGRTINIENKDLIEHVDKMLKIPRATAEESDCVRSICRKLLNFLDIPNMASVPEGNISTALKQGEIDRFAGFRVAFVGKLTIAVDDMIATPLEFRCHRGFTDAGNTLDQIVSDTHDAAVRHSSNVACAA